MKTNALEITLSWAANPELDLSHYQVCSCDTIDGEFEILAVVSTTEYATTELEEGDHYFKLRAVDEVGNKSDFGPVSVKLTIDRTPPSAPGIVTITIGVVE